MRVIQPAATVGPLAGTAATLIPDAAGATALAVMGLLADSVTVQVMANGASVYNQTVAPAGRQALVFEDLPGIPQSTVTVTLGGAAPAAALVAIGPLVWLGITNTGPTVGITDYSLRTTDDFGVTTVVQRDWAKTLSLTFNAESAAADAVEQALATLRAKACVWIADESLDSLMLYGIIKDWSVPFRLNGSVPFALTLTGFTEVETTVAGSGDPAPDATAGRLQILVPLALTDDVLMSSTVPETVPAWDAGVGYAADQTAAIAHRVYQALTPNTGIDPTTDSATWLDTGPTTRWAPFDQALGTAATLAGTISYVFAPYAGVMALAAVDVAGASVRVRSGAYDEVRVPTAGAALFLDMAVPAGQQITVDITPAADGNAAVGTLLFGSLLSMGLMEDEPTVSITDYSVKSVDDFGTITPVERAWAKKMEAKTLITRQDTDDVVRRMAAIRATPVLWIGEEGANLVTVYGFYRDFSAAIDVNTSVCSMTIEGLSAAGPKPTSILAVPWDAITDPLATKPENNATNSGDPESAFGSGTVGQAVEDALTAKSRIAAAESDIATLIDEVESATGTIAQDKDAAAAAAAAALAASSAAATAESNAEQARDQAWAAFTGADAARTAALDAENLASTSATAANGSAKAAAGSAILAGSSADEASEQASVAQASALQAKASSDASQSSAGASSTSAASAEASANAAGASASSAHTSEDNASLSAAASKAQAYASSLAASSAAVSQSAAGQSAAAAQESAVAAATSAGTAGAYAGNASVSASQAATSESNAAASSNTASQAMTLAAASQAGAAGSAAAASGSAQVAQSKADEAGASASSAQSWSNQAQGFSGQASTAAGVATSQAAVAQSNAAAAVQSASLSASIGPGVLNQNPSFAVYSASPGAPDGWIGWDYTGGTPYRVAGINGIPFSVRMDTVGDANCGIAQFIEAPAGKYVVEVTADLVSGTYDGSGVVLQWNNVSGGNASNINGQTLDFLNTADTAGYIGNNGYRRSWTMYVDTGVNGSINQFVLYAMANWDGFPTARSPKGLIFRTLRFRPMSAGEIAGQRGDGNATIALSQIATEQSVRVSQISAQASRSDTMQSQIDGNAAAANSALQTLASQTASLASRADNLEATTGNQSAQISQNATAASNATAAVAQSVSNLQAQTSGLSATVSSQAAALAEAQGKLRAYLKFGPSAGGANASVQMYAEDDNGNAFSEIDFIADRLVFKGMIIGLDNLLPSARSFRRGTTDNGSHAVNDGQRTDAIAVIGTAGTFTSSHYLELDYSLTLSGGRKGGTSTEPDNHPFIASMQLGYRPQGGSWQILPEVVGLGGGVGTEGVSGQFFWDAGDWGLCDIALFFTGQSGDGTNGQISGLSYTLKANAYA